VRPVVAVNFAGFASGAVGMALLGAYVDAFVLPLDEISVRALGSGEFAYLPILVARLSVAVIGCILFGLGLMLFDKHELRERRATAFVRAILLGAAYSGGLMGLSRVAAWKGGAFVAVLWGCALAVPPVLSWFASTRSSHVPPVAQQSGSGSQGPRG
jgi:hypothetical protein